MRTLNQNSISIYRTVIQPQLTDRQKFVLNYFNDFEEGTGKEIADYLQVPFNQISGRFTELINQGLLEETGRRVNGCRVLRKVEREPQQVSMFKI